VIASSPAPSSMILIASIGALVPGDLLIERLAPRYSA
jgi:hypothetical protein